jgi:hypothetical protein
MKIPLDFFLRLIEKFLNEHELDNVVKKLKKHFETPEEDFSDILSELSLQEIISKYVKENKELKKKIKSKIKKYMEENKNESEDEKPSKEEKEEKLTTKKRKRTLSNANEEEPELKQEKRRKRTMSSTKEEKEEKEEKKEKKRKRTLSNVSKEEHEEKKEEKKSKNKDKKKKDDDDIDLEKEVKFIPKPKSDNNPNRVPFKRIDDSKLNYEVPEKYRDNSYAAYMKQTGDDFGKAANDKLIVTRGKGFRKEKTKFKNKTFHGGMTISTSVRSIKLEDDSSED